MKALPPELKTPAPLPWTWRDRLAWLAIMVVGSAPWIFGIVWCWS